MRLAPSLHRLGDRLVGVYLVEEAGSVTIVDAGVPGYVHELAGELASMGRTMDDIAAVVLTHGHADHIGFAERLRDERGVPVSVHELDAALAMGDAPNPSAGLGKIRLRSLLSFLLWSARHGALRARVLTHVETFGDGATLDVPGALRVIPVPGHTPGSVALHAPSRDALFVGDALATLAVTSGITGPQIAPFTADPEQALDSLTRLQDVEAQWLLPGHGDPWTAGVGAALSQARARGVAHLPRPGA